MTTHQTRLSGRRFLIGSFLLAFIINCMATAQDSLTVKFERNNITYSGPAELPLGDHIFVLKDMSRKDQVLYISLLLDGKTLQDMIDLQSAPGVYYPKPSWVISIEKQKVKKIAEGETAYTFSLNEDGVHAIYTYSPSASSLWFGSSFKVIKPPSK